MNNTIGFFISNGDFSFEVKKVKIIDEYLLIITKKEEIIIYKHDSIRFEKKFILFTNLQKRREIFDVFIMNNNEQDLLVILIYTSH
jgi:hypothetical protein